MPLSAIYSELKKRNIDSLLVCLPANISYLTEYKSRDSLLLISKKANYYITDARYTEEAGVNLASSFHIEQANGLQVNTSIAKLCKNMGLKNVGFEEEYLTFAKHRRLRENLDKTINLIPVYGLIERKRQFKTGQELSKLRQAAQITMKALEFIKERICAGMREIEVAAELERFIRLNGAGGSSFDIIVASGPNSCYPHHTTSDKKIKNNEPVLIDMGVEYLGYKSDLTRVFFLGKINFLASKITEIVIEAQRRAIRKIKPGVRIAGIDLAARKYINQKGYGKFFTHATGHGIGLEIHELPNISAKNAEILKEGMIFTVEPAIYLPGKFGIRIEDTVLVTREGVDIISGALNK